MNIEATGCENDKFYGMEPAALKAYLRQLGLVPLSVHQGDVTLENAGRLIADSREAGFR